MRVPVQILAVALVAISACDGKSSNPTEPAPLSPGQPVAQNGFLGSMTIITMDNPFDCVLQSLKGSGAAPQNLEITISGSSARFESQHFGSQDIWGSITKSESHYEFSALATGYRWYGNHPPSPVLNGLCPEEAAEYVITYARLPAELVESTDRSIRGRIDLVVTAVAYSETAPEAWVPFGETRVVGEIIRAR